MPRRTAKNILAFPPPALRTSSPTGLKVLAKPYETILLGVLDAILDRCGRRKNYPFIDTKIDVLTGRDFDLLDSGRGMRSSGCVYSWIQGRGLESLAGHALWLPRCSLLDAAGRERRTREIRRILSRTVAAMEWVRRKQKGRMSFCFDTSGRPLEIVNRFSARPLLSPPPPGSNISDLFYSKGLLAAALFLGQKKLATDALCYLERVLRDIETGNFYSDQQSFDPKNRVGPAPGLNLQGPWMVALSALALAGNAAGDSACRRYFDAGERFIRHVIANHVNMGNRRLLRKYDFFEAVDSVGQPVLQNNRVICDPGHALEFVGLAAKLLLAARRRGLEGRHAGLFALCRRALPEIFRHVFKLGFNRRAGGICKTFDLVARIPVNTDMPWWSLPETMRAGMGLLALGVAPRHRRAIARAVAECSNCFLLHYVKPEVHFMAVQTRDRRGRPVDVIPATPDADPGYHTGLSMIDFLENMECLEDKPKGWRNGK